MKINCLVPFVFILIFKSSSTNNQYESCQASKSADEQCGSYAYKVVKPLLEYVKQLKEELDNNNYKQDLLQKDKEIEELQEKLHKQNANEIIIVELREQIENYKRTIEQLTNNFQSIKDEIIAFRELKCKESKQLERQIDNNAIKIKELEHQLKTQKTIIEEKKQNITKIQNVAKECENKLNHKKQKHHLGFPINYEMNTLCENESVYPGWTIIVKRKFGDRFDLHGNNLGLKKIQSLTSYEPHKLCVHMEYPNGTIIHTRFDKFQISGTDYHMTSILLDERTGYKIPFEWWNAFWFQCLIVGEKSPSCYQMDDQYTDGPLEIIEMFIRPVDP